MSELSRRFETNYNAWEKLFMHLNGKSVRKMPLNRRAISAVCYLQVKCLWES